MKLLLLLLPILLFSNPSEMYDSSLDTVEIKSAGEIIEGLFEKKEFEQACRLVEKMYKDDPYSIQPNLYYGRCAYYRGDIDTAMAAYDRAEILDEENADLHKHLGDIHVHIGNLEIAKSEYDKADRFGKDKVERSLDSLYSSHSFSILARVNVGYDTNVQYNAENSDMLIYTGDVNYSAEPNSASFLKEYFRLNHTYDSDALSSFYYKNQLHMYNKNYSKYSEDDFTQLQLYSGPGWASKNLDFWIPVSYTYMATDYDSYSNLYSINPQFRKKFDNAALLKVEAEYEHQKYLQWNEGDKDIYSTNMSLSKWFGNNYFRGAYRYLQVEKEDADTSRVFIDRKMNEAELNYVYSLQSFWEFGVGYLYAKTRYNDLARVNEADKRKDKLQRYTAYVSYKITGSTGVVLQYDNYKNKTNYTPSSYKKEVLSGGFYVYY